jgi:hypothetical protein
VGVELLELLALVVLQVAKAILHLLIQAQLLAAVVELDLV